MTPPAPVPPTRPVCMAVAAADLGIGTGHSSVGDQDTGSQPPSTLIVFSTADRP